MSTPSRSVTPESLGAWVVKASPAEGTVAELARRGFSTDWVSCVRPTYRADLVEPGQAVLLWVSGRSPTLPAGIHAHGTTTGRASYDGTTLRVPLRLEPVDPHVLRPELLDHPVLRGAEVLRMPAGGNPSYLRRAELDALLTGWPQLHR
ncbi:hypothetical protein [Nocardioides marmoribigeumensis]|uniref:EVE domain-containing protein n=1 Tax=Nocardioides marmoribigeumensis TaxID=433649 RepID=A0ABU2BQY1_9ACTN|nr:hypothetical protein [Nocardioides marmoribigeumensis]MDR7361052.1 hypothetical protein [Nocardioides marmoribigeumensis]